jgi:nanoRNase/pAp phosphatase (c-di-AMP/oligoRNAs hydrolase)
MATPAALEVPLQDKNAKKLIQFFEEQREQLSPLLILTHNYPDPDALASAYALQYIAEKAFAIQSRIVYGGIVGRAENKSMVKNLKLPVHKLHLSDFKHYRSFALVDTQPYFENNNFPESKRANLVIDQHPSIAKVEADLAIIDPNCGATCVILAKTLLLLNLEIPERVATALAYGILTDTGNLLRVSRSDAISTYMQILPFINMSILAKIQNPPRSRFTFTTLDRGIRNAMVYHHVLITHLGLVKNPDLIAQVADFMLAYRQVRVSFALGRFQGKLHVSLRMESGEYSASKILRDIFPDPKNAGGHDTIAGGSMKLPQENAEELEVQLIRKLLKRLKVSYAVLPKFPLRDNTPLVELAITPAHAPDQPSKG